LRVFTYGKPWSSDVGAVAAGGALWIVGAGCTEGQKLASDLNVALRVGVYGHTQPAIEVVVLFRAQVVELLACEGLVARKESVPVALELDDEFSPSLNLL
jgi:hypothetical protein